MFHLRSSYILPCAAIALLVFLTVASAHAQQSVYPTDLTTNDCNNPGAFSRVWYVGPSGSNWTHYDGQTTIVNGNNTSSPLHDPAFAVSVTEPGDLICVLAGTYGPLLVYNSGTENAWIKYEAMPGATVTIDAVGAWNGIQISANYIQVSGFTVVGANESLDYDTAVSYEDDPGHHADYNGNCISAYGSTSLPNPHHINILQNNVQECPGGGISTVSADYVTISGNVILDTSWFSAYGTSAISNLTDFDTDDNTSTYKMFITNNVIFNNFELIPWIGHDRITDGEGIIVDSNLNHAYDVKVPQPAYNGHTLIANNVITRNGSAAIEIFESSNVDVLNNSTYGNVTTPSDQPSSGSSTGELYLYTANNVRVLNNIFYAYGNSSPIYDFDTCPGCYIDYNVYYGTVANHWPNGPGTNDAHSHNAYPDYTSVAPQPFNNDLTINGPYTNILNAGTGWLAPATDINGKTRAVSSSYTTPVGAYAYP